MNRLTAVEDGRWTIYGVDFEEESEIVNKCLERLAEYEETGVTPEFIEGIPDMLEDVKDVFDNKESAFAQERIGRAITLIDFIIKMFKRGQ